MWKQKICCKDSVVSPSYLTLLAKNLFSDAEGHILNGSLNEYSLYLIKGIYEHVRECIHTNFTKTYFLKLASYESFLFNKK